MEPGTHASDATTGSAPGRLGPVSAAYGEQSESPSRSRSWWWSVRERSSNAVGLVHRRRRRGLPSYPASGACTLPCHSRRSGQVQAGTPLCGRPCSGPLCVQEGGASSPGAGPPCHVRATALERSPPACWTASCRPPCRWRLPERSPWLWGARWSPSRRRPAGGLSPIRRCWADPAAVP